MKPACKLKGEEFTTIRQVIALGGKILAGRRPGPLNFLACNEAQTPREGGHPRNMKQRQSKLLVEQRNVLGRLWFGPRLQVAVDVGEI
jgi:hypothetical protein